MFEVKFWTCCSRTGHEMTIVYIDLSECVDLMLCGWNNPPSYLTTVFSKFQALLSGAVYYI